MYRLSYNRALALYRRWLSQGIDLRKFNTEVIIAGSGFSGINRDKKVEENISVLLYRLYLRFHVHKI